MSDDDPVALVTGGGRRVGRAIAMELARAGYAVAVHCRHSVDDARETAGRITAAGRKATVVQADLTDPDAPGRIVEQTVAELGGLNVLVNNASVWRPTRLSELSHEVWEAHLQANVVAPSLLAQAAWDHLRRRPPGHVINLCDVSGERPWADYIAYCVSKGALITLTRALAKAMAPEVCVNGISPGVVLLPDDADEQARRVALERVPLAREGDASDVAAMVRFLAEEGGYITGQIINVDGGRSIA